MATANTIVTRDAKRAWRDISYKAKQRHDVKRIAQRSARRIEKRRLVDLGEDYFGAAAPRLTGWDVS